MKIEQLPSGSYRVRMSKHGKSYSLTYPYKPTEKQAYSDLMDTINHPERKYERMTFSDAYKDYVEMKDSVLSPSTLRGYKSMFNNLPNNFIKLQLDSIDRIEVQKIINEYAKTHSPKSTHNMYGFISTILSTYNPNTNISVTLPDKVKNEPYTPSEDDVKRIFEYFKGTEYEAIILLLGMGLRRSEAMALTVEDFDTRTNEIKISKAKVQDENNKWVVKPYPKNESSNRTIVVPSYLTELVHRQGYVYKCYPNQIYKYLTRAEKELGIPHFSVHKMRHYFVTYAHSLGISDANIMSMTGHSSQKTLDNIYRHAMNESESKKEMATRINALIP